MIISWNFYHSAKDEDVRKLIDSTRIHLMPSMNPDGWKTSTDNVSDLRCFNTQLSIHGYNYWLVYLMRSRECQCDMITRWKGFLWIRQLLFFRVEKTLSLAEQTQTTLIWIGTFQIWIESRIATRKHMLPKIIISWIAFNILITRYSTRILHYWVIHNHKKCRQTGVFMLNKWHLSL